MASTLNIMVFTVALAFFLSIAVLPPNMPASPLGQILNGQATLVGTITSFFNNPTNILAFGSAIAIGVTFFPNMWAIFLLPTIAIFGWAIFPQNIFTSFFSGVTSPIIVDPTVGLIAILNALFQLVLVLSIVSWYKSGPDI